jgi:hypothetical protein
MPASLPCQMHDCSKLAKAWLSAWRMGKNSPHCSREIAKVDRADAVGEGEASVAVLLFLVTKN